MSPADCQSHVRRTPPTLTDCRRWLTHQLTQYVQPGINVLVVLTGLLTDLNGLVTNLESVGYGEWLAGPKIGLVSL